jgi:AcrR family transcriptional regulator
LLDAALAVMLERGYDGASLGEVTERADLGTGTLYLHFRDKRSLYEALVRRDLGELRARWLTSEAAAQSKTKDPADTLRRMIEVLLAALLEHPDKARLFLCDGPPVETWLVEEIGRTLAQIFGAAVTAPELVAHLVVGALTSACRWSVQRTGRLRAAMLTQVVAGFCTSGVINAARAPARKAKSRR